MSCRVDSLKEAAQVAQRVARLGLRVDWMEDAEGIELTVCGPATVEIEEIVLAEAPTAQRLEL